MSDRERLTATIDVDSAAALRQIDDIDRRLNEVTGTRTAVVEAEFEVDPSEVERLEAAFGRVAGMLDVSEESLRALSSEMGRAQISAAGLDDELQVIARSMGLSDSEARKFSREMQRAASAADSTAAETQDVADATKRATDAGSQLGQSWVAIATRIGAAVAAAVGLRSVLTAGWDRFTTIEDSTRALEIQLQSASAAAELMADVLDTVRGTPFNLDQFAAAAQTLVGFGIEAERIPGILTAIGEASATQGARAGEFVDRFVAVFGQIETLGRLTGEHLNRLGEAGVNALAILANSFGVTTEEMRKMISEGAVPAEAAISALTTGIVQGTDGLAGATVALGGTMEGLRETLTGARGGVNAALARLGEALVAASQPGLILFFNNLTTEIDAFTGSVKGAAGATEEMATDTGFWNEVLGNLPTAFGILGDVVGVTAGTLSNFAEIAGSAVSGQFDNLGANIRELTGDIEAFSESQAWRALALSLQQDLGSGIRDAESDMYAFANALAAASRAGILTEGTLARIASITSVSDANLTEGLENALVILQGMGDEAQGIEVLIALLDELQRSTFSEAFRVFPTSEVEEARVVLEEFSQAAANAQLDEMFPDLPTVVGDLESLRTVLSNAGISLQEFLETDLNADGIVGVFTEAETRILATIAAIEEAIPGLREAVITGFDLSTMGDDIEQIEGDIGGFQEFIEERATELAQLDFDLSKISVVAPNLEQLLRDAGLSASEIASAFASNLDEAEVTEALILGTEGMATTVASSFAEWVKTLTPEEFAAVNALGPENLLSNAIRGQLADSGEEIAELLNQAVTQGFDPELILDLNNIQLRGVVNTGQIPLPGGRTDAPGTGGGGRIPANVNYEVNINNPIEPDLGTGVAIATQQIAAVSSLLVN